MIDPIDPPDPQDEDPLEQLKKLKAQTVARTDDPLEQLKNLTPTRQLPSSAPKGHTDASGTYTPFVDAKPHMGVLEAAATHLLNLGQGIPGVEQVEAAGGVAGSHAPGNTPISYDESLGRLRNETSNIPTPLRVGEKMVGSMATLPLLPSNPASAGAVLGGSDAALSADPESLGQRAANMAIGAGVGGLVGKTADVLTTGVRALGTRGYDAALVAKQAERANSARQLYGAAMAEGQGKAVTHPIAQFLAEPDIDEIVTELQSTRPFQGVAADDPKMLDAVYKTLSDRAGTLKKGLESVTPTRPNIGRFRLGDVKAAQGQALDAMDTNMPSYRDAVTDFAQRSQEMDAMKKGYDVLKAAQGKELPGSRSVGKTSPPSFSSYLEQNPDQADAAMQGLLGGTKNAMQRGVRAGTRAVMTAPSLLRRTQTPSQQAFDALIQAGLLGGQTVAPQDYLSLVGGGKR